MTTEDQINEAEQHLGSAETALRKAIAALRGLNSLQADALIARIRWTKAKIGEIRPEETLSA